MATAVVLASSIPSCRRHLEVSTEDALLMTSKLGIEEAWFVGPSSGANVLAARRLAMSLQEPAVVVTILCDGGERYW